MAFKREQIAKGICITVIFVISAGLFTHAHIAGKASDITSVHFNKSSVHTYNHEFSKVLFIPKSKTIATIGMNENSPTYLKLWDY